MSSKQIIINCTSFETRVALIEGGSLCEYYVERASERGIVGSIYKGRVARVLPGMQSAFVDIGLERAAFLYGGDIVQSSDQLPDGFDDDETSDSEGQSSPHRGGRVFRISELVREGQELLVQVAKDAISTKGARVTTYLSLPGRYVVLMPNINHVGVSRRIRSEEERTRLKAIANRMRPEGVGIIVRTASESIDDEKLEADIEFLCKLWESIRVKALKCKAPSIVHEDLNLIFRSTRDLLSRDIDSIIIDGRSEYQDLVRFLNRFSVKLGAQVQLYTGDVPVFDAYGIELEVERALSPKVWLKSGGCIIIEQTEALTAIDVNTGRFVGSKSLGDTILRTNVEAIREIVLQVRLRNIGGIIILDLIDMDHQEDRDRVFQLLLEELKKDKAKTSALRISELGLIQMTRKRTEESLTKKLCMPCPYCEGRSLVKSAISVAYEIVRELVREFSKSKTSSFLVRAHPQVTDRLLEQDRIYLDEIRKKHNRNVIVKSDAELHSDKFEIHALT